MIELNVSPAAAAGELCRSAGAEGYGMGVQGAELGRGMRWLLLLCGPMNVAGAACFAPPFPDVRRQFGLSEPAPFYLWVLSACILAFGVAYFRQGWTGRPDRSVLALGAWGKGVFAGLLVGQAVAGELPPSAGLSAIPDLALAVVFAVWLWRSSRGVRSAEPSAAPGPAGT